MYENRTVKKKKKTSLGDVRKTYTDERGKFRIHPLAEMGALLADYAKKDDEISELWFRPVSKDECCAVLKYEGDSRRIARNMQVLAENQNPNIKVKLYSSKSEVGKQILEGARLLYKQEENTRKRKKDEHASEKGA